MMNHPPLYPPQSNGRSLKKQWLKRVILFNWRKKNLIYLLYRVVLSCLVHKLEKFTTANQQYNSKLWSLVNMDWSTFVPGAQNMLVSPWPGSGIHVFMAMKSWKQMCSLGLDAQNQKLKLFTFLPFILPLPFVDGCHWNHWLFSTTFSFSTWQSVLRTYSEGILLKGIISTLRKGLFCLWRWLRCYSAEAGFVVVFLTHSHGCCVGPSPVSTLLLPNPSPLFRQTYRGGRKTYLH